MALNLVPARFSHVGRKAINFDQSVCLEILPVINAARESFRTTKIAKEILVRGPLGTLKFPLREGLCPELVPSKIEGETLLQLKLDSQKLASYSRYQQRFVRSMWGTSAAIIRQQIRGVSEGYQVALRLVGIGYRASVENGKIILKLGFSHNIEMPIPTGITAATPQPNKIVLSGIDYHQLTVFAACIRTKRKPEPYNGKGIFVGDETIKLKEGKKK